MPNTNWKIRPKAPDGFLRQRELQPVTRQLIFNRGLTESEADDFLRPALTSLHSPMRMKDMEKGVSRIKKAISNKEKILVYGDYDADGVCSTVVLLEALWALGAEADYYIPDRETEGYGMNENSIAKLAPAHGLIITVDCGITNYKEIELAGKLGADVIVTDHHLILPEGIPKASAVIDPNRPDDDYPDKELAGVGVVFKLIHALARILDDSRIKVDRALDLVAIATVGDVCKLLGENRVLVKTGLDNLWRSRRVGLQKLFEYAAVDKRSVGADDLAYRVVPRINAAGRMAKADLAVDLLSAGDEVRAQEAAYTLHQLNSERQDTTKRIVESAKEQILDKDRLHFVVGDEWSAGILGLVAGKLSEEYSRPVIVARRKDGLIQGSARSPEVFNVTKAIGEYSQLLNRYGGHAAAAGFELPEKNLSDFIGGLKSLAERDLKRASLNKNIDIDMVLSLADVDFGLLDELETLTPYGEGNPEPVFAFKNLKVADVRAVGSDKKHLKLRLASRDKLVDAIGFGFGELSGTIDVGDKISVAGTLSVNKWNGHHSIQINIKDIKA